jgi:hypothetical protein
MIESSRREEQSVAPGSWSTSGAGGLEAELTRYPELELVLWLVVSVVAEAYSIDEDADPGKIRVLERAAAEAMVVAYAPIAVSTRLRAAAVEAAREAKALTVSQTAEALASRGVEAATALRERGDESAQRVAAGVVDSAARAAAADDPGGEADLPAGAALTAAQAQQTADVLHDERSRTAERLAQSDETSAVQLATKAGVAALAVEFRSLGGALLVESVAIETCYQLGLRAASSAARGLSAGAVPTSPVPERQLSD